MPKLKPLFAIFICLALLANCTQPKISKRTIYPSHKLAPNDPFAKTMVESETFELDPTIENIIEGKKGTVVLLPEGALVDKNGKIPNGKVTIELAEALDIGDMLLSNLTTMSDGKPLQSDGMIYINATDANGRQLHIDTTKPLYIEVPTENKIAGMQVYSGIRDSAGNMNWVDPKPIENYLVTVDLAELDFLPDGFFDTVKKNMPYHGHLKADKALADSLYYSLAVNDGSHYTKGFKNTNMNEAHRNANKKIENGKYTDESYDIDLIGSYGLEQTTTDTPGEAAMDSTAPCGINPASVKVLKSEKFANTFIATREFESRMRHIHHTCKQEVLEIYIEYIDKNLWEADKRAYEFLKAKDLGEQERFKNYYTLKLGKVKDAHKYAEKLAEYYREKLKETVAELEALKQIEIKELQKENEKVEKVKAKYRKVLWKREKHRMEKYGFTWTRAGWINIDTGFLPKACDTEAKIEVTLNGKQKFDRAYTYIIMDGMKSIYRLNTQDNILFYGGNIKEKIMNLPCAEGTLITIAYIGETPYFWEKGFFIERENNISFKKDLVYLVDEETLKNFLKRYNRGYKSENRIDVDLEFQAKFYKEQQRQKKLINEQEFIRKLNRIRCYYCLQQPSIPQDETPSHSSAE
jgi:hypothetical protein